jgi:peptidoglycan glycosyltransferase
VFVLFFVALAFALPYWAVIRGPALLDRPENIRPLEEEARMQRGRILDVNGVVLARSESDADGYVKRIYTTPALAHVTGYWSLRYGVSAIEADRNDELRSGSVSAIERFVNALLHRPTVGRDVVLTLDSRVQAVADAALGQETGAIVVLNARSGAVLVLASHPFFDPNQLEQDIARLQADAGRPLLNRATQGLYPPGSTFKAITLAAALESGVAAPSTVFTYTLRPPDAQHHGWWHVSEQGILCENHPSNHAPFNLTGAFIWSCNVAFGDLGLRLGAASYTDYASRFGIGRALAFDLPVATSQLYRTPDYLTGQERFYALASTAFGQGEISVTPLQMALAAAAVVNDGNIPQPYLVSRVLTPNGLTTAVSRPRVLSAAMSPATAALVRDMMIASVNEGWAQAARVGGAVVGGKTGTAETSAQQSPHSWFIGFAGKGSEQYAIAVVMERAGFGSAQAAPAAKKVIEALLK